jgi:2-dehydropantoate 2-reductase
MGKNCWVKPEKMKILVMGAGAIGSLFGGLLAENGNDVILVGRQSHMRRVRESGLKIEGLLNKQIFKNLKAEVNLTNFLKEEFDLILLTVKAYDTKQASTQIKKLVEKKTMVVCLQNGLGVEDEASEVLGKTRVLRAVTFCGAYLDKPGTVRCTGFGETFIGEPYYQNLREETIKIAKTFEEAGFPTKISANIHETVWTKTLVNVGINPYGALTRKRNGELIENREIKELMVSTVREGVDVAEKVGVNFKEDPVDLMLKTAEATAKNLNSMLQDLLRGKKTEIDYLNGAIVKLGEKFGVPTPLNRLLTVLIKTLEKDFRENPMVGTGRNSYYQFKFLKNMV